MRDEEYIENNMDNAGRYSGYSQIDSYDDVHKFRDEQPESLSVTSGASYKEDVKTGDENTVSFEEISRVFDMGMDLDLPLWDHVTSTRSINNQTCSIIYESCSNSVSAEQSDDDDEPSVLSQVIWLMAIIGLVALFVALIKDHFDIGFPSIFLAIIVLVIACIVSRIGGERFDRKRLYVSTGSGFEEVKGSYTCGEMTAFRQKLSLNYSAGILNIACDNNNGTIWLNEKIYIVQNNLLLTIYAADSQAHQGQPLFKGCRSYCDDGTKYYAGFNVYFPSYTLLRYFNLVFKSIFKKAVSWQPPKEALPADRPISVEKLEANAVPVNDKSREARKEEYIFGPDFLNPSPGMGSDRTGIESIGKTQDPGSDVDDQHTCGHRRYFDMTEIGMLSSGLLYHAVDYNGRSVLIIIMDVIRTQAESYSSNYKHEMRVLENLHCTGVPAFVEKFEETTCKYMILSSIAVMPLSKMMEIEYEPIFQAGVKLLLNLCQVLIQLNKEKLVHVDISPDTVLVDDQMNVRIVGFGRSVKSNNEVFLSEEDKTVYMAPEIWDSKVSSAADIYSSGLIVLSYLSGKLLTEADLEDDHLKNEILSPLPEWFRNIIMKMTAREVSMRLDDPNNIYEYVRMNVMMN